MLLQQLIRCVVFWVEWRAGRMILKRIQIIMITTSSSIIEKARLVVREGRIVVVRR
jgi:hypothetical protein